MRIRIAQPILGDEEIERVSQVIKSGMIASGPETSMFEQEFSEYVGSKFACAVNNGTSAICLALSSAGVGPGDEVITTPLTFVATANAILSCGAIPVFADVDEQTYNLCPHSVERMITKKTKAVMPVHLYGLPADMASLQKICVSKGIILIGDAAQAHGAEMGGKRVGTLAPLECFSFYPTKNMTTGEGGMVTTDDEGLYDVLVSTRNHGRPDSTLGIYDHERFGLNLRMTDIGSAIGRVQLRKLVKFNRIRERNAKVLSEKLSNVNGVIIPRVPEGRKHSWHQYTIRVRDRESLAKGLRDVGIESRVYYPHLVSEYKHLRNFKSNTPVASVVVKEVISVPVHPGVGDEDAIEIADQISSIIS